jgi:hypothetical protein
LGCREIRWPCRLGSRRYGRLGSLRYGEGRLVGEPGGEGVAAEVMHDGARGVVAAGVVAGAFAANLRLLKLQDEALEDFAQHLRVDGDIHVQRSVFADGEIIGFQQVVEDVLEGVVAGLEFVVAAHFVVALLAAVFVGKKAAVEEGEVVAGDVGLGALGAELDEEGLEGVFEETDAGGVLAIALAELVDQVLAIAIEPALALDEIEEQEAVEKRLGLALDGFFGPAGMAVGDVVADLAEGVVEVGEELFGNRLFVEGPGPLGLPGLGVGPVVFGPGEVREVMHDQGAQVSAALPPAEGGQFGAVDLVAFEMGESEALVIGGGADEEEVFLLPGLEAWVAPPVRDEAAQNLAQGGAVHLRIGKLNEEDAPGLAGDKWAELTDRAAPEAGRLAARQTKLIR